MRPCHDLDIPYPVKLVEDAMVVLLAPISKDEVWNALKIYEVF